MSDNDQARMAQAAAALVALADAGISPDIGELLTHGNPLRGVAPGAIYKLMDAISLAAPAADEPVADPFAYMLRRPDGSVFWDEDHCVWTHKEDAEEAAEENDMTVFGVFAHPPAAEPVGLREAKGSFDSALSDLSKRDSIRWAATEDDQHIQRMKACKARCKKWGACDERDGSCSECDSDMAEALETAESMKRRLRNYEARVDRFLQSEGLRAVIKALPTQEVEPAAGVKRDLTSETVTRASEELAALATLIERPPLDDVQLEQDLAVRSAAAIRVVLAALQHKGAGQ